MRHHLIHAVAAVTLLCGAIAPSALAAQALSGDLTVDNSFTAYLSTSVTTQGSTLVSGTDWTTTYSFGSVALTPGQTYYLQVRGTDVGVISAFIGDFTLDGAFTFANGSQFLTTNTTDWFGSATGFGVDATALRTWGANGTSPWGARPNIDTGADFIWTAEGCTNCTRYFWTTITPTAQIPEPASFALLVTGALGLAGVAVRRRRA